MIFIKIRKLLKIITLCVVKLIKHKCIIIVVKIDLEEFVVSPIIDNFKDNFRGRLYYNYPNNNDTINIKNKNVILISFYANEE